MAKRRFIAPMRSELGDASFEHPVFDHLCAFRPWLAAADWPSIHQLNSAMPVDGTRFVAQDRSLLDDGLHYETRIAERGQVATREQSWHDLFNAMIWCRYPAIKRALNAQQCAHITTMGSAQRNRAQYALTQFDEAGAIVCVRDPALLALWNRHDWTALFHGRASSWHNGDIRIAAVIGHALLEHALVPELFLVGKCVAVQGDDDDDDDVCVAKVAQAIAGGRVLSDPQQLRPLPLAGIPGWYPGQDAGFFAEAACFQPLREDRRYPSPV